MNLLESIAAAEQGPTPEQLADAPRLDGWWIEDLGGCLRARGDVSGHPDITDPFVTTSPVLGLDTDAGWLRTVTRFYRLGPQLVLEGMTLVNAVPLDDTQQILAETRTASRAALQ